MSEQKVMEPAVAMRFGAIAVAAEAEDTNAGAMSPAAMKAAPARRLR
jgi:hypothetical protein